MNARNPAYDADLVYDLATGGLTYDEFQELHGLDTVSADERVRDLKNQGYSVVRRETGRGRVWTITDIKTVLDGDMR